MSVRPAKRHTRANPCCICGGWDDPRLRGRGQRCWGFDSDDGQYIHCTRPEYAGQLPMHDESQTYAHRAVGECRCELEHAPALVTLPTDEPWYRRTLRPYAAPIGTLERYYVYYGLDGRPVHRTVRYRDPKEFRQERYEHGAFRPGLRGIATVLYRLPELARSADTDPAFICEGEKDADRLASLGLIATCSPSGLAWKEHYTPWFQGRTVVICQDNDDAGKLRAAKLCRALRDTADTVIVVSFDHMHDGADISDWLDAGGTVEELLAAAGFRLEVPA